MNRSVLYYRIPLFIGHVYCILTSNILNSRVYGLKWRQRTKLTGTNAPHSHNYIDENNSDMLIHIQHSFLWIINNLHEFYKKKKWKLLELQSARHFQKFHIMKDSFQFGKQKTFFFKKFSWKKLLFWFKLKWSKRSQLMDDYHVMWYQFASSMVCVHWMLI